MTSDSVNNRGRRRSVLFGFALFALLLVGAAYAWTLTPSYSLYQIKQALETHDYVRFTRYVAVDSVLDHALAEFAGSKEPAPEEPAPGGPLARALRKGLRNLTRSAREMVKAGLEIAVEQAVKNQDRPLPQIPAFAVIGALWQGQWDGETVSLPVEIKKRGQIEVKMQHTSEGIWQVVEISPLSVLLPTLKPLRAPDQPENE